MRPELLADLEARTVLWRSEFDKIQYEHRNPLHRELVSLLEKAKAIAEPTSERFVFPCPHDTGEPKNRKDASKLWRKVADAAGITVGSRLGTHSFRRAFANRLRNVPLRDPKDLGGWKTEKTVIVTYLQPDQDS
jgi:integrase